MNADNPEDFFRRNAISFKRKGHEAVTNCHECGKSGHLYVNLKTFLWHCKKCDAKGNETALKKGLGLQYDIQSAEGNDPEKEVIERMAREMKAVTGSTDVERWTRDLVQSPAAAAARQYLFSRGIPLDIAEHYRLGWSARSDGGQSSIQRPRRRVPGAEVERTEPAETTGWIVIPSFTKWDQGRPVPESAAVVKLRSVPPAERQFRRIAGADSVLFAPTGIDTSKPLLIVAGELDAISCVIGNWPNVISTTTGETGWDDAWTVQLEACDDIIIIYDNDDTGRKQSAELAAKLGVHRVRIGAWPANCKDANEALQKLGQAFDPAAYVAAAASAGGDTVVRMGALKAAYLAKMQGTNPRGLSSGWEDLDAIMGGLRGGEVTLLTGDTSSGKSTFGSQLALQVASLGIKTLVCPFEMGAHRQLDKWVRQWSQHAPDTLPIVEVESTIDTLDAMPIWLLNRYGTIHLEPMRNTLMYAIRRLGVWLIVVDHLHFMVEEGPSERGDLDAMMKMLAEVATDCSVHIVVVAHPRQHHASDEKHRDNRIIQMSDLKGSSGLKQMSDNILSVWRPRKADRTGVITSGFGVANVYLLKVRSDFGTEGSVAFKFVIESARFEPPDPSMISAFRNAMGSATESQATPDNVPVSQPTKPRRRVTTPAQQRPGTTPTTTPAPPKHWTEEADDDFP